MAKVVDLVQSAAHEGKHEKASSMLVAVVENRGPRLVDAAVKQRLFPHEVVDV